MISAEELKGFSKIKKIANQGNAEKDYLLELVLFLISRNSKDELVFKGGTCLSKFYGLDRFSEDVDFSLRKEIDIGLLLKRIVLGLRMFGIEAEIKESKKVQNSASSIIRTKGPLYKGTPNSLSSARIDVNLKSEVDLEPAVLKYQPIYPELSSFTLMVMQEKEILAEKVRAIMTREKARDVYDLWFLLNKKIDVDFGIISKKLDYYNIKWNKKKFEETLKSKKKIWEKEMGMLIETVPDFSTVTKEVLKSFK